MFCVYSNVSVFTGSYRWISEKKKKDTNTLIKFVLQISDYEEIFMAFRTVNVSNTECVSIGESKEWNLCGRKI